MAVEPYLDGVRTDSYWAAWWLRRVRGYRLSGRRSVPRPGLFGRIKYDRWWVLVPPDAE